MTSNARKIIKLFVLVAATAVLCFAGGNASAASAAANPAWHQYSHVAARGGSIPTRRFAYARGGSMPTRFGYARGGVRGGRKVVLRSPALKKI
jgi:hypothetical protein